MTDKPFLTHNDDDSITANGTSLQAYLHNLPYTTLVDMFGEPSNHFDDFKCDAEWYIEFPDGEVATIYNWKDGKNYCGPSGKNKEEIRTWHIGGKSRDVVLRIHQLLSKTPISYC